MSEFKKKLCMGCMELLSDDKDVCPRCGYDNTDVFPSAIAPETILNDRYLVGRVLYDDKFGTRYLAYDITEERKVVLKRAFADSQQRHFFKIMLDRDNLFDTVENHIENVSGVPNFLPSTDVFIENEVLYMVESYSEGITLREYLLMIGRPLEYNVAMHIFIRVAQALKALHKKHEVYGLLSIDRVIITPNSDALLSDSDPMVMLYADNKSSFLPKYFTPCEYYSDSAEVSQTSDVYSLAALLYYMLCGTNVPVATDREYDDNVIFPSTLGIIIPRETEQALLGALELYPEERTKSIEDFINAVQFNDKAAYKISVSSHVDFSKITPLKEPQKEVIIVGNDLKMTREEANYLEELEQKDEKAQRKERQLKNIVGQMVAGEDDHATKRTTVNHKKVSRKSFPMWAKISILVVLGCLLIIVGLMLLDVIPSRSLNSTKTYVETPNLTTLSISRATELLQEKGLNLLVVDTEESTLEAGMVSSQLTPVNENVLKGSVICVHVSSGKSVPDGTSPNLIYTQLWRAYQQIKDRSAKIVLQYAQSTEVGVGCILEQSIFAGNPLTKADTLYLTVSAGSAKQNLSMRISKCENSVPSTVVFMNYGDVYDVRQTDSGSGLDKTNMPQKPIPSAQDAKLVFIGWSLGENGSGVELTPNYKCSGIVTVYSYYAQRGMTLPTVDPNVTITPIPMYTIPVYTVPPIVTPGVTIVMSPTPTISIIPTNSILPTHTPVATTLAPEPTVTVSTPTPTTVVVTPKPTPTATPRIEVTGVTISQTTLQLEVGQSDKLVAHVQPHNASNPNVTWGSQDKNVATIDQDGIVTAHKAGITHVYVITSDGYFQADCVVTVIPAKNESQNLFVCNERIA